MNRIDRGKGKFVYRAGTESAASHVVFYCKARIYRVHIVSSYYVHTEASSCLDDQYHLYLIVVILQI